MDKNVKKLIDLAYREVGIKEMPAGSNNVKYNEIYYGKQVSGEKWAWCAVFIWWLFKEAGLSDYYFGGKKTASCTTLFTYYKKENKVVTSPSIGDLVFYSYDRMSVKNHIGLIVDYINGQYVSIEGNYKNAVSIRFISDLKKLEFVRIFDEKDGDSMPTWADPYVKKLVDKKIIDGTGLTDKCPKWMVAVMLCKLLNFLEKDEKN